MYQVNWYSTIQSKTSTQQQSWPLRVQIHEADNLGAYQPWALETALNLSGLM